MIKNMEDAHSVWDGMTDDQRDFVLLACVVRGMAQGKSVAAADVLEMVMERPGLALCDIGRAAWSDDLPFKFRFTEKV